MHLRAAEDMECPGQNHPGQSKKERPKHNNNKMRRKETPCPGLDHLGRNKQQPYVLIWIRYLTQWFYPVQPG